MTGRRGKPQEEKAVTCQWNPLYGSEDLLNGPREGRDDAGWFRVSLLPALLISLMFLGPL